MTSGLQRKLVIGATLFVFLVGLKVGMIYQNQILESRFQAERFRTAQLRFEDWSTFTAHLADDRRHPDRNPLLISHSQSLAERITSANPILVEESSPAAHSLKMHGLAKRFQVNRKNPKPGCD